MIIKSYTADSVAGALKQVRAEMGGDAVVLNTRQLTGSDEAGLSGKVEITACIDGELNDNTAPKTILGESKISQSVASKSTENEKVIPVAETEANRLETIISQSEPNVTVAPTIEPGQLSSQISRIEEQLKELTDYRTLFRAPYPMPDSLKDIIAALQGADMPQTLIDELIQTALKASAHIDTLRDVVRMNLQKRMESVIDTDFGIKHGDQVVFVGPPGSGKTSVLGKLAAELVTKQGMKVRFASFSATKVGAINELESYAAILGSEVSSIGMLKSGNQVKREVTLLDSPAISVASAPDKNHLSNMMRLRPNYCLAVFSATTRTSDAIKQMQALAALSPTHLVITKLDLSRCWGLVYALCRSANVKLALISNSASGIGWLQRPSLENIVSDMLGETELGHE